MNNNPMNGFGMNTNDYGNNGGFYPQMDNAAGFGNAPMTTGNPTLDLLNQSNGIVSNAGNVPPASTGNPTLDLLNQSQAQNGQDSSYGFVPAMNEGTNSGMDMNNFNQPQPMPAFGLDNNTGNGMMPNYGASMNSPMPQQPLDYASQMPQPVPMEQQYQQSMYPDQSMMQPSMDYNAPMGQMVQQPLTSMEMTPVPEPAPVVENTNPYGFVPMMPTPEPEPTPAPAATSTGEFNFSFIPLREENTATPVPQPPMENGSVSMDNMMAGQMPMEQSAMPQMGMPGMEMQPAPMGSVNGQMIQQPVPTPGLDNNMGNGMMPDYGMSMNPPMPQPVPMEQQYQQPMYPEQPMMQQPMGQMPMGMQPQPVPMDPYNGQMVQQPMMQPAMGTPMGYPQMMPQQPVQDPNAIYPGIPDDVGNPQ